MSSINNVYLWLAGSVNYLTAMVILLSFILVYHRYIAESEEQNNDFFKLRLLLLGVVAVWCNENSSGGALFIVVAYTVLSYMNGWTRFRSCLFVSI